MKKMLVVILALTISSLVYNESFAEKNTFFDSVKFIQYLDENTALEEVRNGNLDAYYYTISPDRIESEQDRRGLQVFDSTGGSYSILINPANSEEYNPFASKDARFALNYLVDRKLIVNELMGGYGSPITSYYGPSDPEYITVVKQLEAFDFKYNPALADEIISGVLNEQGAVKTEGRWQMNGVPIEIIIFIRSDDPVRKSIGEILATELEDIGFSVRKDFGDLNKAFVVVYGSNPSDMKWNLYTEGWGRSAFVKYDSVGLGQMYSPWFSNMPGFNDPTYWNYENEKLDNITQKIYTGDFDTREQRTELIQEAVTEGINESVRIFLASKIDQYVVNDEITGAVNDFGAGIPSRFTPINAKNNNEEMVIGVKQIYQGAWNPVMGLTDSYSRHIWGIVSDPAAFKHPFTGETFPVRATWEVKTSGSGKEIDIPQEAIMWNEQMQKWEKVEEDLQAKSMVTFDFKFSDWHNGEKIDMNDVLHALYFTIEWGAQIDEADKTFDTEFTPRAAQSIQTIKGINQIDTDTIEIYVDYGHFDEKEIAYWATVWSSVPWEITAAMEKAVTDGKTSFSRSGSVSKNVSWLSLIIPNDADIIKNNLHEFKETKHVPQSLRDNDQSSEYFQNRYDSSIKWIETKDHAVISNGPFYLESYSPESRTIKVKAFEDDSYPFKKGAWSVFEKAELPMIKKIDIRKIIQQGEESMVTIDTQNTDSILYFLTDGQGTVINSNKLELEEDNISFDIVPKDPETLKAGVNSIKIFAISNSVSKPDFYESSFMVTESKAELPASTYENIKFSEKSEAHWMLIIIPVIAIVGILIYVKSKN